MSSETALSGALLSRIPFFAGIAPAMLKDLETAAEVKEFLPGHCLIKAGEQPALVAFIVEGQLQAKDCAESGRLIGVQILGPGALVGWLPVMDGLASRQTIEVIKKATLLLLPIQLLRTICCGVPELASRLLQAAGFYVRNQLQSQGTVHLPNAYHRVFVCIHKLVSQNNNEVAPALPKQQEIAASANTSRETVSRALQALIRAGVVVKEGHSLIVKKGALLQELADKGPDVLTQQKRVEA